MLITYSLVVFLSHMLDETDFKLYFSHMYTLALSSVYMEFNFRLKLSFDLKWKTKLKLATASRF